MNQIHIHVHKTNDASPALSEREYARYKLAFDRIKAKASSLKQLSTTADFATADRHIDQLYELVNAAQEAIRVLGE